MLNLLSRFLSPGLFGLILFTNLLSSGSLVGAATSPTEAVSRKQSEDMVLDQQFEQERQFEQMRQRQQQQREYFQEQRQRHQEIWNRQQQQWQQNYEQQQEHMLQQQQEWY
ncbi:MAG: hypothetical protein Kow00121_04340 [Elainellaceae cyanobacterium]